jgi:hypothetical protein
MSPSLPGLTGGTSTGSTAIHVVTDNRAGYQMTIAASTTPAMTSGANSIADYTPATTTPDFLFSTSSTKAHFGFSPEGTEIQSRYRDNGTACGVGALDTVDRCWDGLATTAKIIAAPSVANHPNGATTTIKFQVGIGSGAPVIEGTYTATTTITVVPL